MRFPLKMILLATTLVGATSALGACTDGYDSGVGVGYDAAWGDPYWGWYGDFYYPGTGIYVYDHNHHRYRWNDSQRAYWEGRRSNWRGTQGVRNNWGDFGHRGGEGVGRGGGFGHEGGGGFGRAGGGGGREGGGGRRP